MLTRLCFATRSGMGGGLSRDVTQLLLVAEAADEDGRPWEWEGGYPQTVTRVGDVVLVANTFEDPDNPSRFAEFISTFDPPTVRRLLHVVAEERGRAERLQSELELVKTQRDAYIARVDEMCAKERAC